ncbi:FtsB family cell division protein [Euzebya tangerina]|uniref:FtsB family cell division protein n=1 Tax=Euzebya tangerina TaxID=591198 RepID=UPI000E312D96|nr:septum formation initiator family protein [Euzebya tangerina]
MALIGAMALTPWASLTAATDRVDALEAEQAELDAAVEELQAEADRLQDPLELEGPAREDLGLSRPGEIPYIITNPPSDRPEPAGASADGPGGNEEPSVWQQVGSWFADLLP